MNFINCDFHATYKQYVDLSNEDLTDTIYRRELLSFFKCSEYNDTVISIRTDKLFLQASEEYALQIPTYKNPLENVDVKYENKNWNKWNGQNRKNGC